MLNRSLLRHSAAMKRLQSKGFTLAELLLVMVIAGILSAFATQGWHRWQQRQQLRDTALHLQHFLLRVRAQANAQNRDLVLWHRPTQPWCIGVAAPPQNGCSTASRLHFIAPYADITLHALRGEPGFYGRRNVAKAGSIELRNRAGKIRVIISSRARIRLCRIDDAGCE